MSSPANKRMRLSTSRTSLSGRMSLQGSQSTLPRPTPPSMVSRQASTQPTYDFITNETPENAPPARRRSMLRQPSISRLDQPQDENLRAKFNTLEYELKNLQQERNMAKLQHEKELRDVQARADADYKKAQVAQNEAQKATQRYELLQKEVKEMQDHHVNEKTSLGRKLRDAQDQNSSLREDAQDAQARLSDQERHYQYQLNDLESKRASLQETVDKMTSELQQLSQDYDASQSQLLQRASDVESLEAKLVELKSQGGNSDALNVLQTQLSEQVSHIRKLETTNREQLGELRRLRDNHRSVQVVEEQKRGLETELQVLKEVEKQLGEAQIQKEILLDEKRQWISLLEQDDQQPEFASPEAVVKALVQARIELASQAERTGTNEAELLEKDEMIKGLENENTRLKNELRNAVSAPPAAPEASEQKAYKRLERQKNLAVKETEYLRAQLKTFDSEETMENPNYDAQRSEQIKQLEVLVDQYRSEISTLHSDLSKLESTPAPQEPRGTKRRAESQDVEDGEETSSQVGALLRKNKNLQVALQKTAEQSKMLATELQASKKQLKSLRDSSKTRILEFKDNPTAQAEAIKASTLKTLKEENATLLAQLRGEDLSGTKVVPVSTVDALKLDLAGMQSIIEEKDKRMRRQREIWTDKAAEFRDVIASVLGWKINFLPNGKAKVSSMFYGSGPGDSGDDDDSHYIVFDGENGTMKISGGVDGSFAKEIQEQVDFWVKEKKEIPCFLAALTLHFYEEYSR